MKDYGEWLNDLGTVARDLTKLELAKIELAKTELNETQMTEYDYCRDCGQLPDGTKTWDPVKFAWFCPLCSQYWTINSKRLKDINND